jgi:hypothetical protein
VAYDNTTTGSVLGNTTVSFSHTCSGTNRALMVFVGWASSTQYSISVSYNGIGMATEITEIIYNSYLRFAAFSLINPTSGSNTLTVTLGGTCDQILVTAISFTNVNQNDCVEASSYASGYLDNPPTTESEVNVTTITDGGMVADSCIYQGTSTTTLTVGADQTQRANFKIESGSSIIFASSTEPKVTAGNVNMSWDISSSGGTIIGCVAIKPVVNP